MGLLCSLREALTPEFMLNTPGGLLLIYDEIQGVTHLGWIKSAVIKGNEMIVELDPAVTRKHESLTWDRLDSLTHKTENIESFTALPEKTSGGFHCTDTKMVQATFKIYPVQSIPAEYTHDHEQLIKYGDAFQQ